jgi:hypothetical protein
MAKKYKKTSRLMQRVEQRKKGIAKERPGLKPLRAPKRKEEVVATPNNYKAKVTIDRQDVVDEKKEEDPTISLRKNAEKRLKEMASGADFTDMAVNVFDELKGIRDAVGAPKFGSAGIKWMRDSITALNEIADISVEEKFIRDEKRLMTTRGFKREGQMFMFNYQPVHKSKLAYYDTFPVIFILKIESDGFLGINLHYLPPQLREKVFINLLTFTSGGLESDSTRLILIYEKLMARPKFRHYIKPCIKKYLYKRIDSFMLRIPPEDWYIATFLPLERFLKKHRSLVWVETRQKILQDRLHSGTEEKGYNK